MDDALDNGPGVRVTLEDQGWEFDAGPAETLLKAAERAGIALPSSCRNGTCRTCLCQMRGGAVRYVVEWPGLSVDEKREGCILPCVAVALTDLRLAAPLARRR
ncbi:MAG: 2Fe-2S iron-sulfur cluster-binding protein [Massilia sp.]